MGKISDESGAWLEDEAGHGIYDLAGITENPTGALTIGGALTSKSVLARSDAGTVALQGIYDKILHIYMALLPSVQIVEPVSQERPAHRGHNRGYIQ
jgi:hypothetical protein